MGQIPDLQKDMRNVLGDYRALLSSSQAELTLMVKINHAKVVSRIGFVAQDMKVFESYVTDEIQNRANENGRNDTECLFESRSSLQKSAQSAGEVIVSAAKEWKASNDYLSKDVLFSSVQEIQVFVSSFETEFIKCFSNKNSVTELSEVLKCHKTATELFMNNFELHIYEILVDMFVYDIVTKEKNKPMFIKLDDGWQIFQTEGKLIVQSLQKCE